MKARWCIAGAAVLLLALAAGVLVRARTHPAPPRLIAVQGGADSVHLGEPWTVTVVTQAPWRQPAPAPRLELPEGIQQLDATDELAGLRWGAWRRRHTLRLQAYDFGPFAELPGAWRDETFTVAAPTVQPRLPEGEEAELTVAPALPRDWLGQGRSRVWLGVVAALLALLGLAWLARRRRPSPTRLPAPPWQQAMRRLDGIEARLPLPPEDAYQEISDVVRAYLELAFALRATEQTTPEFLASLRGGAPLTVAQEASLAAFLRAADLVKFARAEASQEELRAALEQARHLVRETARPAEPENAEVTP